MSATSKRTRNAITLSGGALVAASPFVATGTVDAGATTFHVTNTDNSGPGSLRQAIVDANATADADTIVFDAGGTGTITVSTMLVITESVTITGPGAASVTVSGGDSTRIFYIGNEVRHLDVAMSGITIADGHGAGGGILNMAESITLDGVVATGNTGSYGAFLYSRTTAGEGDPTVTIRNSTFTGNTADKWGAAVYVRDTSTAAAGTDPVVVIENSTFSGNTSTGEKGAAVTLYWTNAPALIVNSTFTGNTSTGGGALYIGHAGPEFVIANSTISGNTATTDCGGGLYLTDGTVTVVNSIISGNSAAGDACDDIKAPTESSADLVIDYSIIGEIDADHTDDHVITSSAPMLGALADNGGATETMLPQAGSPAINAGDPAFVAPPSTDQRGLARVAGGRIDIGSVETGSSVLPPTGGSNGLMAAAGAALLALGGALHLTGRRKRPA